MHEKAEHKLDISAELCPMTFVKTKLMLEKMAPGSILEVRLAGAEPLENVPRSVRELGHEVLALDPEAPETGDDPAAVHRLLIRKAG